MKVFDISLKEIFDSRGESTVEVSLKTENSNWQKAQIPSGRSRGKREATVLTYDETVRVLEDKIKPNLIGRDFDSIYSFDDFLIKLDGTPNKNKLGGNLILGLSLAFSRCLADERNQELWQIIRNEFFRTTKTTNVPKIFANLINGGAHANNNLDVQEYMVITDGESADQTFQRLENFYKNLGEILKKERGLTEIPLGDEGGYVLDWSDNFAPLTILEQQLKTVGLDKNWRLGIDAAASNFYQNGIYVFENKKLKAAELKEIYMDYFKKSVLCYSIEDPFSEDDGASFSDLKILFHQNKLVVGDDLTVTNPEFIKKAAEQGQINAVIIKPNQIGSVSETCQAIQTAHTSGVKCIISHRSGETDDCFLVHFAKAADVFGIKIGAPVRERLLKYQEWIRLYS